MSAEIDETKVYNCSNCGAVMEFDVASQSLKCSNCDSIVELNDDRKVKEFDFSKLDREADIEWEAQVNIIKCESCGAETTIDSKATASFCSFCGSSHILETKQSAGIKPEALIPFKVDKNRANEIFIKWMKGRFFAPNALKAFYQNDKFHGIYIPYWTFDSNTTGKYTAQGGQHYYVTVQDKDGKSHQERRTRWYPVSGVVDHFFDDVLVNASNNSNSNLINKVEPFNTVEQKPFLTAYISGFLAEHYTVLPKNAFETAKYKMQQELEQLARRQVLQRYDEVSSMRLYADYRNVTYKHLLVPVWIAGYDFKGKYYSYVINAQSGRIIGEYPKSPVKIVLTIIFAIIVFVLVYYAVNTMTANDSYSVSCLYISVTNLI